MSDRVLLNLLSEFGEVIKCEACRACHHFFAISLINEIIREPNVRFCLSHGIKFTKIITFLASSYNTTLGVQQMLMHRKTCLIPIHL